MRVYTNYFAGTLILFSLIGCAKAPQSAVASSSTSDPGGATVQGPLSPTSILNPPPAPLPVPTQVSGLDSEEQAFLVLINNYRVANGAPQLQVSLSLTQSSQWMSTNMATQNYFSHTDLQGRSPFTRMADFGYTTANSSGENIAAGNASAAATFTQWKNSPGHNANMLNPSYLAIGIGRAEGSTSSYGWYWTTDFGSTVDATMR